MDILRRSFRRGSVRRRPLREPLAESPSLHSTSLPKERSNICRSSNATIDRLRRSFRRNFRSSCEQPITSGLPNVNSLVNSDLPSSIMDRLRCSVRRRFHKETTSTSHEQLSSPPPATENRSRRSSRRIKENQLSGKEHATGAMSDKLERNFRRSFRRQQKEAAASTLSSSQLQSDEIDVRAGICFFNVKVSRIVE